MTSPASTPTRRWRILALAAALPLAALLVGAGPATAQAAEPPPVSCITRAAAATAPCWTRAA
jgi:hypothetical protein